MYNQVILVGRLTRDPDVKYTQSGKCVTSFTLAVDQSYARTNEEKKADFIPIIAWEKLAETCGNYLNKGNKVLVEGRLQIRTYETNDGQKRWVTEVIIHKMVFLEKKPAEKSQSSSDLDYSSFGKDVFPDEEIPF